MQTFLPYESYADSAKTLDRQRLGKQRVECLQILNVLLEVSPAKGWKNHPAVRMWRGHEPSLVTYTLAICQEWQGRGYKDTVADKVSQLRDIYLQNESTDPPAWLGDVEFHLSHRSNLIRKLPEHYGKLWPQIPDTIPYYWPV